MAYFKGKSAIVTGGASGIGRGLCLELGRQGAEVTVADINLTPAEETAAQIISAGGRAEAVFLDVTRPDQVEAAVRRVAAEKSGLDLMFNNAGVVVFGDVRDLSLEDWQRQIEVNLSGAAYGARAAFLVMAEQGRGHIVNTASMAGLSAVPTIVPYTMTKYGLVGLSLALRAEGADLGVRVSVVCPGFVRTGMFDCPILNVDRDEVMKTLPESAIWTPERAARAILKGVLKNKDVITFPSYARPAWWVERTLRPAASRQRLKFIRDFRKIRRVD